MQGKAKYIAVGLLIIAGLGAGGHLHHTRTVGGFLSADSTPQLDYLAPPESFSRVENTKNELVALCRKLRLQCEARVFQLRKLSLTPEQQRHEVNLIINQLQQGLQDFAGTGQEFEVVQDLLLLFKSQGELGQWVDLYLRVAYQHPTDPLVGRVAEEAIAVGRTAGREEEVMAALKQAAIIPIAFEAKAKIIAVLNRANHELAKRAEPEAHPVQTGS